MRDIAKRVLLNRWLVLSCRLILVAVFLVAAIGKIARPQEFADAVAAFRILPIPAVNLFAIVLPWIETLAALSLLHGSSARSGAFVITGLNALFLLAVGSAMTRGLDIKCGCFTLSHAHSTVGWALLGRDSVLLLLCLPFCLPAVNRQNDI